MVAIRRRGRVYNYENKSMDTSLVDSTVKRDFAKFCKENNIHKGKLIEEFMRRVVLRFKTNSLNQAAGYVTLDVMNFKKR